MWECYEPDDPDEGDVCHHGKGFDEECSACDDEEYDDLDGEMDEFDGPIPVCPECGSDDLTSLGEDAEGNGAWECEECGATFTDGEEEDGA